MYFNDGEVCNTMAVHRCGEEEIRFSQVGPARVQSQWLIQVMPNDSHNLILLPSNIVVLLSYAWHIY